MGKSINKNPMASNTAVSPQVRDPRTIIPRDQAQSQDNPYGLDKSLPDNTVCTQCGAVHFNHHWHRDDARHDMIVSSGTANEVVCPGCLRIKGRDPQGIVTLRGDYWPQHREDILNLIRNEEARGIQDNPLERIMDIREEGDALVVEVTNTKLAQRMGRAVHKAHSGEVNYNWSDGDHLVRVYWERNLAA